MADNTNISIDIKRKTTAGETIIATVDINEGARAVYTLGSEDYVELPFTLYDAVNFKLGDYIDLTGLYGDGAVVYEVPSIARRYEITELQGATYDSDTGGYKYTLKFEAYYRRLRNRIYFYSPDEGAREAAFSLTTSLTNHMGVFIECLAKLGMKAPDGSAYTYTISEEVSKDAKALSFSNTSLLDALTAMAEAFETEWWVKGHVIHFGDCEHGEAIDFEEGVNVEDMTSSASKATYATRIFAYGSTRNISKVYHKDTMADRQYLSALVDRRLMLPAESDGTYKGYIDSKPGLTDEEVVEQVVTFDEIYPRTMLVITELSTVRGTYEDSDTGETVEEQLYRFRCKTETGADWNFTQDDIIDTDSLTIKFCLPQLDSTKQQIPTLLGMEFGVAFNPDGEPEKNDDGSWNKDAQVWQIVPNEDYGRRLPESTYLQPKVGDCLVLLGWDAYKKEVREGEIQNGIVHDAEVELKEATEKYIEKSKVDPNTYTAKMMLDSGSDMSEYAVGRRVQLKSKAAFENGSRLSRIIGYEISLDVPYDHPQYVVGETASFSRLGALEQKLDDVTSNGVDGYYGSNGNSDYAKKAAYAKEAGHAASAKTLDADTEVLDWFLSKLHDDEALNHYKFKSLALTDTLSVGGKTTSLGGVQFGKEFIDLLTGQGGYIDAEGHAVLRSIRLWEFMEVPELRFNQVRVYTGVDWHTFGGGIVESVEVESETTGVVTLKLEDGAIGAVDNSDLCVGIWHMQSGNDTSTSDERNGNFRFAGFKSIYFRIDEILEDDCSRFRYVLRGGGDTSWRDTTHPQPGMHFACYANPEEADRQWCVYSTTQYTIGLRNMTTWTYGESNIYKIDGLLDGFSMGGIDFQGVGNVFGNAYIFGSILQWRNAPLVITIVNDGDSTIGKEEERTIRCVASQAFNDVSSTSVWTITRSSGDRTADTEWNASHSSFNGEITLSFEDLSQELLKTLFTVTATTADGKSETQSFTLTRLRNGTDALTVNVIASNGTTFRNGQGSTTLTAYVILGGEDITDTLEPQLFRWTRVSDAPEGFDEGWNTRHESVGNSIDITPDDVLFHATFFCEYVGTIAGYND